MKHLSLVELKVNQKARVVAVEAGRVLHGRLLSLGIYPGREVIKLSQFMLKGPLAIKVGRSIIAIGWQMASKIMVEVE